MANSYVQNSFIALSDFHSYNWPLNKVINYYLNEYQTIYILGDALDRGPTKDGSGGIQLLLNIKQLAEQYPGRVIYVPGNHDQFLYDYACGEAWAEPNLLRNGGTETMNELNSLLRTNPNLAYGLLNWLGFQPIQRVHNFNGKRYVLAHALFNEKLYKENPSYALKDLNSAKKKNPEKYDELFNVLWFRKNDNGYVPSTLPRDGATMIIGHTPPSKRQNVCLDLTNDLGQQVKVVCVDGGIAYNGYMLKYDGGEQAVLTQMRSHNDTSPKQPTNKQKENAFDSVLSDNQDTLLIKERIFRNLIINVFKCSYSKEEAINALKNYFYSSNIRMLPKACLKLNGIQKLKYDDILGILTKFKFNKDGNPNIGNIDILLDDYIAEVCLKHIYDSSVCKFGNLVEGARQVDSYIATGNRSYITESIGNARNIASKIGIPALQVVLMKNGFNSVQEYMFSTYGQKFTI